MGENMKKELTNREIKKQLNDINTILKDKNISEELRFSLEERKTTLSVIAMNHWFPRDLTRRIIMLAVLMIGILGSMSGSKYWLFIFLILPFFSPKIVMNVSVIIGFLKGDK